MSPMCNPRVARRIGMIAVLATAVVAGPADAKRKKKVADLPPPVHRCTLDLSVPDGEVLPVVAWGLDEAEAAGQVRRTARLLAELHAQPDAWSALLHPATEWASAFASPLREVPSATDTGAAHVFPLPGYAAGAPTCAPESVVQGQDAGAWEVAWTADSGEKIRRSGAATALETARRRACLVPYQREVAGMWRALAQMDPGQRQERFQETWTGSRDALMACFGATRLHDGASTEGPAYPWIRPAGEAAPSASSSARPMEAPFEGYECLAVEFSAPQAGSAARGWGRDLEWAQEAALGSLVYAVSRDAFAQVAYHMDAATPETLPSLIAGQALRLTHVVAPVEGVEALQLGCAVQQIPAGGAAALRWSPADPQVLDVCEPDGGWSAAVEPLGPEATSPFDLQLALQQRHVFPGLMAVRSAWEAADADTAVAVLGLGAVAMCEASSLGDVALEGTTSTPAPEPWAALRASPELARALFDRAMDEGDLAALVACIHPQQRPSTLLLYERTLASDGDPAPFWLQMRESLPPAIESGRLQWGELDGGWLLVPADAP